MYDYRYRSIGQLDSQRSIPDPKGGNMTSTPQTFTFGPQFLVVQTQTFIDEKLPRGKCTDSGFKILSLFLFDNIL